MLGGLLEIFLNLLITLGAFVQLQVLSVFLLAPSLFDGFSLLKYQVLEMRSLVFESVGARVVLVEKLGILLFNAVETLLLDEIVLALYGLDGGVVRNAFLVSFLLGSSRDIGFGPGV